MRSQELCARTMTMEDAYQVKNTLQSRASNVDSNSLQTLCATHIGFICIMTQNGRLTHGPWIVGGTISWSWNGTECQIFKSMGQSWYEWYKNNYCLPGPWSLGKLPTRTTRHQDHYKPIQPLIRANIYTVGNCLGGEMSGYNNNNNNSGFIWRTYPSIKMLKALVLLLPRL